MRNLFLKYGASDASPAIWDHTVLPISHPTMQVDGHNPDQESRCSIYLPSRGGRL